MEERDQPIIERYLANELSETERNEVEQRRKDDSLFNREVMEYELAREAMILGQREKLRQRFIERDKKLDAGGQVAGKSNKFRLLWVAVAAIVVVSLLLWKFLFTTDHPSAPIYSNGKDSILVNDRQIVDSPSPKESQQKKMEVPEERKMDMAETKKRGEELFAENFEPYKDETMSPVSRGDEEQKPLDKFRQFYWDGLYPETVATFSTLNSDHQKNDNIRFIYAIALTSVNRNIEAQSEFIKIIDHHRSIYIEQAHWYLGLVYLKQGDMTNASKYLQYCVEAPEGYHKTEAADLLKKIK